MLNVLRTAALVSAAASISFAASLPSARGVTGNYMEARTADVYTGPCFANGEIDMAGKEAVLGWKINQGFWQGVDIAGLGVVAVVRSEHTLGDAYQATNPAEAVLILDERADAAQREALTDFAKHQAGDLLNHIVKVHYAPIDLTIDNGNIHGGAAQLTAGSLAAIRTRAMTSADDICGNEKIWYPPLTALNHVMPAYALEDSYSGDGLGETWNNRLKRSSFLGTFQVTE